MNIRKTRTRILLLAMGVAVIALLASAFLHQCLHFIDHNESADSTHHCLLCMVFSHTILSFNTSGFLPIPGITNRPFLLTPILSRETSVQASVAVRAPPPHRWN